jgi:hypothetical protein
VPRGGSSSVGTATVEFDGLTETLKAFQSLEKDFLRPAANAELRRAAGGCAGKLALQLHRSAQACGVPVAPRVARSIQVNSDRMPTVKIGGSVRVGRRGAPAGRLVWGSEKGPSSVPNHFGVAPSAGYWIKPVVEAFNRDEALDVYRRAIVDLQIKYGLL